MKQQVAFLILLVWIESFVFSTDKTIKIRSFDCTSSNKSVKPNFKCFSKSYSRKLSVMNVDIFVTRRLYNFSVRPNIDFQLFLPLNSLQAQIEYQHGSGITPYYTTIINSTFYPCRFLNGTDPNPLAKVIFDSVAGTIPQGFFHPCPYYEDSKAYNVSVSSKGFVAQFVKGRYKISARLFDELDSNIITFLVGIEL